MTIPPEGRGQPDVSITFAHDPASPRRVRRALEPLLSDDDDPIAPDVNIVASELVSNVVQHTGGGGTVAAWDPKPDVPFRLEVGDRDDATIQSRAPSDRGGRGLGIVDQLADAWGVDHHSEGKTVWAEFDRTTRTPPHNGNSR